MFRNYAEGGGVIFDPNKHFIVNKRSVNTCMVELPGNTPTHPLTKSFYVFLSLSVFLFLSFFSLTNKRKQTVTKNVDQLCSSKVYLMSNLYVSCKSSINQLFHPPKDPGIYFLSFQILWTASRLAQSKTVVR